MKRAARVVLISLLVLPLMDGQTLRRHAAKTSGNFPEKVATPSSAKELGSFDAKRVFVSLISPDGSLIAAGTPEGVVMWDRASGHRVRLIPNSKPEIKAIDFSRSGGQLALAYDNGDLKIEDARTGAPLASAHAPSELGVVSFSNDGRKLGFGTIREFGVWGLTEPTVLVLGKQDFGSLNDVRFSPDGKTLVVAGTDANLYIADLSSGKVSKITRFNLPTYSMVFAPGGKRLFISGAAESPVALDTATWKLNGSYPNIFGIAELIDISPDGKRIAMQRSDQRNADHPAPIIVWDISGAHPRMVFKDFRLPGSTIRFVPSGELLFTRWSEGKLRLYSFR